MRRFAMAQVAVLAALMFFGWTPSAHAYIDPTAAGAALQSLYVIVASALMAVALVPKKIAEGFMWLKNRVMPGRAAASTSHPAGRLRCLLMLLSASSGIQAA